MHDERESLYWAVRCDLAPRPAPGGRHRWEGAPQALPTGARRRHAIDTPTEVIPVTNPDPENPPADTAGEQDHSDPWAFAGEDAEAPQSNRDDVAAGGES